MTFHENINRICREHGTYLTQVMKALGLSTSKVTAINNGSIPSEKQLHLLAAQLNCSVADFFADEKAEQAFAPADEDEADLLSIYRKLSRRGRHELLAKAYELERQEGNSK